MTRAYHVAELDRSLITRNGLPPPRLVVFILRRRGQAEVRDEATHLACVVQPEVGRVDAIAVSGGGSRQSSTAVSTRSRSDRATCGPPLRGGVRSVNRFGIQAASASRVGGADRAKHEALVDRTGLQWRACATVRCRSRSDRATCAACRSGHHVLCPFRAQALVFSRTRGGGIARVARIASAPG